MPPIDLEGYGIAGTTKTGKLPKEELDQSRPLRLNSNTGQIGNGQ